MKPVRAFVSLALPLGLAGAMAVPALAQDSPGQPYSGEARSDEHRERGSGRVEVQPYIEISQIILAEISPGDDVVTYTQLAAGVDAAINGRNNGGSVSLRYARNIAYEGDVADSDILSGIARGYATVVPDTLMIEGGALASRTRLNGGGASLLTNDASSRVYTAYAGPNLRTEAGDVQIEGNYRVGYTRIEQEADIGLPGTVRQVDLFDESVVQTAAIRAATRPGEPLPVGVALGAGYTQEDISNFDQRVRDLYVRADVTVPLSPTLALLGGIGYEDVEISGRTALLDDAGVPIIGNDGRVLVDTGAPRRIAYDTDGLIWDVGVLWRPSTRTTLEAHLGRRYDSTTYYGSFAWAPDTRSNLSVSVYDTVTGFGGQLNRALAALPTNFAANRNPLTGDITGCVAGQDGSSCLSGAFGSIRAATFRNRGVAASYSRQIGRSTAGMGAGYDRRSFFGVPGTVLAAADGTVDENFYLTAFADRRLGPRSSVSLNAYAQWFESEGSAAGTIAGDGTILGASAAYRRSIRAGLSARAAVAIDRLDSDFAGQDLTTASALLGLRYDF